MQLIKINQNEHLLHIHTRIQGVDISNDRPLNGEIKYKKCYSKISIDDYLLSRKQFNILNGARWR